MLQENFCRNNNRRLSVEQSKDSQDTLRKRRNSNMVLREKSLNSKCTSSTNSFDREEQFIKNLGLLSK